MSTTPPSAPPPRAADVVQADINAAETHLQRLREELATAQWLKAYDRAEVPA